MQSVRISGTHPDWSVTISLKPVIVILMTPAPLYSTKIVKSAFFKNVFFTKVHFALQVRTSMQPRGKTALSILSIDRFGNSYLLGSNQWGGVVDQKLFETFQKIHPFGWSKMSHKCSDILENALFQFRNDLWTHKQVRENIHMIWKSLIMSHSSFPVWAWYKFKNYLKLKLKRI